MSRLDDAVSLWLPATESPQTPYSTLTEEPCSGRTHGTSATSIVSNDRRPPEITTQLPLPAPLLFEPQYTFLSDAAASSSHTSSGSGMLTTPSTALDEFLGLEYAFPPEEGFGAYSSSQWLYETWDDFPPTAFQMPHASLPASENGFYQVEITDAASRKILSPDSHCETAQDPGSSTTLSVSAEPIPSTPAFALTPTSELQNTNTNTLTSAASLPPLRTTLPAPLAQAAPNAPSLTRTDLSCARLGQSPVLDIFPHGLEQDSEAASAGAVLESCQGFASRSSESSRASRQDVLSNLSVAKFRAPGPFEPGSSLSTSTSKSVSSSDVARSWRLGERERNTHTSSSTWETDGRYHPYHSPHPRVLQYTSSGLSQRCRPTGNVHLISNLGLPNTGENLHRTSESNARSSSLRSGIKTKPWFGRRARASFVVQATSEANMVEPQPKRHRFSLRTPNKKRLKPNDTDNK